jgi:hypothetical protein
VGPTLDGRAGGHGARPRYSDLAAGPPSRGAIKGTSRSETAQTRVLHRTRLRLILCVLNALGSDGVGVPVRWMSRPFSPGCAKVAPRDGLRLCSLPCAYYPAHFRGMAADQHSLCDGCRAARRPRSPPRRSEGPSSPAPINKTVGRSEDCAPPSFQRVIASVAGRVARVLVLPFVQAIKRRFGRNHDRGHVS